MAKWVVLLLVFAAWPAMAADDGAPTAPELAAICEYETSPEQYRDQLRSACMSFIRGFFGYHEAMRMLNAVSAGSVMVPLFCLPKQGETLNSLRMRFILEAKKDEPGRNLPAGFVMLRALMEAFPCPAK
jgi:hypothetical protein